MHAILNKNNLPCLKCGKIFKYFTYHHKIIVSKVPGIMGNMHTTPIKITNEKTIKYADYKNKIKFIIPER